MPSVKKPTLDDHTGLICHLLRTDATNDDILQVLLARQVKTSLESVRIWVNSNSEAASLKKRGKGRLMATFNFVPEISAEISIPPFVESILEMFSGTTDSRFKARLNAAADVFQSAGILFDITISPREWILPARALSSLSDLELTLIAYILSDRPGPPTDGGSSASQNWLQALMVTTSRLKARIKKGGYFTFAEIG